MLKIYFVKMSDRGYTTTLWTIVVVKQVISAKVRLAFNLKTQNHKYTIIAFRCDNSLYTVLPDPISCAYRGLGHETKCLRCTCTLSAIGPLSCGTIYYIHNIIIFNHDDSLHVHAYNCNSMNINRPEHFSTSFHMCTCSLFLITTLAGFWKHNWYLV